MELLKKCSSKSQNAFMNMNKLGYREKMLQTELFEKMKQMQKTLEKLAIQKKWKKIRKSLISN